MTDKLSLRPGDYIVFQPGLRIENTTKDYSIEFELPDTIKISLIKRVFKVARDAKKK